MSSIIQRSFTGGEIAPPLYARVDTQKYANGLRGMRNNVLMRHGGSANRAGAEFIGEVKDSSKTVRLIPFIFNSTQTYALEFGDQYMRVIRVGAQVTETAQNITAITNANPCVLTYSGADNYAIGDEIYISGIIGPIGTYLNNRNFKVAAVNTGTNAITLDYMNGTDVNSTSFGAYTSGGTIAEVYTIATPYLEADLPLLKFVQSADVITIVHPDYAPRELARTGHTAWSLSITSFKPAMGRPAAIAASSITAGALTFKWKITAVNAETGEESLPGLRAAQTITAASQANPCQITVAAHGLSTGDQVYISGIVGMTELNDRDYTITYVGANTFTLDGVDSTAYTAYSSGGSNFPDYIYQASAAVATAADPHVLGWTAVSGASEYNIYQDLNGVYGFIGVAGTNSFNVIGSSPDTSDTPPARRNPFEDADDYPSTVSYIQQRLTFANSTNNPETTEMSRIGQFKNFTRSNPIQDDDAVTFTLAGRQVNSIKSLLDIGRLVVFTSSGEWAIQGDSDGSITPTAINPKQYTYNGSSDLSPLVIGGNALYVQARGSIVRDLGFDYESSGYRGNDLTVFSPHLFEGYTLTDWAYQQIPHSIVWCVRSDGVLLGLTYLREHEIWGWHRHDFEGGLVESVCSIPEDNEDALYVVVKRTINGSTKRYIERFSTRVISDIKDAIFLDSALTYDGRHTGSTTMTLSGGTNWTYDETITLTASASTFTSADVGNEIHLTGSDGTIIRFAIAAYSSATVVTGTPNKTVPAGMRSIAITTWARAVDEVTGLWHLEGESVSITGDGFVVASPNNAAYNAVTVANGTATLDRCYSVIHVGLPYTSDLETLDIDTVQGETISDKSKLVNKVTVFVEKSRGGFVGAKPPTDDDVDPLEGLTEFKERNSENYDEPIELLTGTKDVTIRSEWNSNGRIFIRQVDPLPLSILAVVPAGLFPFQGGR